MKTIFTLFVVLALVSITYSAVAQETQKPPKTGFFLFNQNKVAQENVAKVNAIWDSTFTPILNELMKEGKLLGWGLLMHAWGDEWNYNFYFVTENHRAFLDFWSEFFARVSKRFPGLMGKITPMIIEHKDNMYSIHAMQ